MLGALPFPVPLWDKQLGSYSEPPLFVHCDYWRSAWIAHVSR
jgi:hypothetical protein